MAYCELILNMPVIGWRVHAFHIYNKSYERDTTDDNNSNDDHNEIYEFELIDA